MHGVRRRLFKLLWATSLILAVLVAVAWAASYSVGWEFEQQRKLCIFGDRAGLHRARLAVRPGVVLAERLELSVRLTPAWLTLLGEMDSSWNEDHRRIGFITGAPYRAMVRDEGRIPSFFPRPQLTRFHASQNVTRAGGIVVVPMWSALCVLLAPTVVCAAARARCLSRRSHGRCTQCGYDLRASPERCPECGTATEGATA